MGEFVAHVQEGASEMCVVPFRVVIPAANRRMMLAAEIVRNYCRMRSDTLDPGTKFWLGWCRRGSGGTMFAFESSGTSWRRLSPKTSSRHLFHEYYQGDGGRGGGRLWGWGPCDSFEAARRKTPAITGWRSRSLPSRYTVFFHCGSAAVGVVRCQKVPKQRPRCILTNFDAFLGKLSRIEGRGSRPVRSGAQGGFFHAREGVEGDICNGDGSFDNGQESRALVPECTVDYKTFRGSTEVFYRDH